MDRILDAFADVWTQYVFTPEGGTVSLILTVLSVVGMWLLFKKANKAGWRSLVPILNVYTLVQIGDGSGLKFLLFFIPVVNVIYYVIFGFRLARAFGKGTLFGIALLICPPLFILVLGLGSARYKKR